jgi:hypothetical protein
MTLRINEALATARINGRKVTKTELAARLWPTSKPATRINLMITLSNGRADYIKPEWIKEICIATGVSPQFLLGMEG